MSGVPGVLGSVSFFGAGICGALLIIGSVPLLRATVHLSDSSPPALANGSVGLVALPEAVISVAAGSVFRALPAGLSVAFSGDAGMGCSAFWPVVSKATACGLSDLPGTTST